jgi:hypothetical protein
MSEIDDFARCKGCGATAEIELVDEYGLRDSIVKATEEEVILEIACKEDGCYCVWRAVYAFAGNQ